MLGLVIIDMQKWMFRYPERAAQIDSLVARCIPRRRAINGTSA
jgi:hypothetical protein